MKKDSLYFEGHDAQLIYIAKRLKDATKLEAILTAAGLDFGVEADDYVGGVVFRRVRTGAFFYVLPEFRERAEGVMRANSYMPLPPEDQTAEPV